ncbi:hypothetical protein ACN28C_08240 [Plantactinospora sp. WMMC1484]|uniref:hypothetical protein n=1 Tax=Plantactinospora sp. WMMC1484 TaxID=3404122 RepID=UPI003BF5BAB7
MPTLLTNLGTFMKVDQLRNAGTAWRAPPFLPQQAGPPALPAERMMLSQFRAGRVHQPGVCGAGGRSEPAVGRYANFHVEGRPPDEHHQGGCGGGHLVVRPATSGIL